MPSNQGNKPDSLYTIYVTGYNLIPTLICPHFHAHIHEHSMAKMGYSSRRPLKNGYIGSIRILERLRWGMTQKSLGNTDLGARTNTFKLWLISKKMEITLLEEFFVLLFSQKKSVTILFSCNNPYIYQIS